MIAFFSLFLTPALVASLFTLLFNARSEKRKVVRDSLKESFGDAQKLVETSVEVAAEYFSRDAGERTPVLEAQLWLRERELRFCLAKLVEKSDEKLKLELENARNQFDDFISELIGGNFQVRTATADLKHVRKLAGMGAELRHKLSALYFGELKSALDKDILDKFVNILQKEVGVSQREIYPQNSIKSPIK